MRKITAEEILNWHGSDHDIQELAQHMADILNGEWTVELGDCKFTSYGKSIEKAREEIISYNEG